MILLNTKKECSGCSACAGTCPARCIRMEEDAEGFLYPAVQADACIGCGLCERICPMRHPASERMPSEVWAARNNDTATRIGSSSGGIFLPLARLTLRKGGLVFGAAFESDTFGGGNPAPQRRMRGGARGTRQIQIRTKRYVRNLPGGGPRP